MSNVIRLSSAREGSEPSRGNPFAVLPASMRRGVLPAAEARRESQVEESMLDQIDQRDRLRLVEFVCSFAWADLEIQPEERVFISRLIQRLDLDEEEDLQVQQWLDRPPSIDNVDPTSIPAAHRRLFVEAIEGLIAADGAISDEERETFEIFKQLLED